MKRNKNPDKRHPVNIVRQNDITRDFRNRGGKVWQDEESEAYLKLQRADATLPRERYYSIAKKTDNIRDFGRIISCKST